MKRPCVYLLTNKPNGTLYIGVTSNLINRMEQHKSGIISGFTQRYGIKLLVWFEEHSMMTDAIEREKAIKQWQRAWKIELIESINPKWQDLSLTLCF
ncbi:GIY-YIG nuclease family protein [Budvicia aquatica]|uniref:GIY-YIG nuclease superfamily protein n=1 Tax=Budvicia aquatica TaxID=82979 RepID=A0A2C6DIR8_9GAMM|nr:GIY-YIG nuclease family protein [Budvicia aquatica]PHI29097.1 hypothetical protein CRN84_07070 [Budvicia aquatica]VFS47258.1 GIY-YIG nuclease superfamily protein [Budvicia aquatica]